MTNTVCTFFELVNGDDTSSEGNVLLLGINVQCKSLYFLIVDHLILNYCGLIIK